jgi:hypothetical protein
LAKTRRDPPPTSPDGVDSAEAALRSKELRERGEQFREEAARLGFEYTCDACVHFGPKDDPPRCSLGYPLNQDGGRGDGPIVDEADWTFCKYFELN